MSQYKPYAEYKDSEIDWLGDARIPADWEACALRWHSRMQSGDFITAEAIENEGDYPVYGGNGLRGYTSRFTHHGHHVLIGRQGALCGNVNYASGQFWASEHAVVVTPNRECDTRWLGEILRAMDLNQYSVSAAQPGLAVERIKALEIPIPPLKEQAMIGRALDRETARIDALIAKKSRFIELLKEKRLALVTAAVTKGLDPGVKMKDSGVDWIGEVPGHWKVLRIARLFREAVRTGRADLPVLSISIHSGISDTELTAEERDRKVSHIEDREKYKRVVPGDLAYNMMRAWQGAFGAVTVDGLVSPAYVVAEPLRDLCTAFVECQLRTPMAIEEMRRFSRGVTDFRMRLYWEQFRDLCICLPPVKEQEAILAAISQASSRFDALEMKTQRSIDLLKERRSALITAAVTGQIDLREAA